MRAYRSCAVGAHNMDQLFLCKKLDEELIWMNENGYSVDSVTPHFVYRGKDNEYLEYIIVYSAEVAKE